MKYGILLLLFFGLSTREAIRAQPRPATCFGNGMVLQSGKPVSIWGKASPGEKIRIRLGTGEWSSRTAKDSSWRVVLPAQAQGGPHVLVVSGKTSLQLEDVWFGEVWVASGQSNMEWKLKQPILNQTQEIASAQFPGIRFLDVRNTFAITPQSTVATSGWRVCTPQNAPELSAVAYFFAREIHKTTQAPIGLILSEWGGTPAEAWMSREGLRAFPEFDSTLNLLPDLSKQTWESPTFKSRHQAFSQSLTQHDAGFRGKWWEPGSGNDQSWKTMTVPGIWENAGLPGFDGAVWFRKEIDIPAGISRSNQVMLRLSTIDDMDSVWVNGVKINGTRGYDRNRNYTLPDGLLKPGKNFIAIRVIDWSGNGGLWGAAENMKVQSSAESVGLSGEWQYRVGCSVDKLVPIGDDVRFQNLPTALYNGMMAPLLGLGFRGVIWYQGESNANRAEQYRRLFPALILDWRKQFGQGEFPFYFVQLANYMKADSLPQARSTWAELREAQTLTLSLPKTGMATAVDIGEAQDIHPKNKQEVGRRLARLALHEVYGQALPCQNPRFEKAEKRENGLVLSFVQAEKGLTVRDRYGYIRGFAVAGSDRVFHWAQARIEGGKVFVYSPRVSDPQFVRYGWANNPDDINLYNDAGLPLIPFRTDP